MRKWLLIGGTLAFLIAVFAAFMWSQRGVRISVTTDKPLPASRPSQSTQLGSIGRTESAWVMTYDKTTGLPQARFRGEQFVPQQGDQIFVERPQVEFFVGRSRSEVVSIVGRTGVVIIPGEGPRIRSDFSATPTQPPSRGAMRDVTVRYYKSQEAAAANKPELTLTLNNAYFDSELYEIATEDYTNEQGVKVPGKQVPVTVRGESFEFDGEGLHIRWDEHSQRLKSLTIHKGHQLVIKRPAQEIRRPAGRASLAIAPGQFVATDNKQVIQAATAANDLLDHLYRATFHENVTVTQKGQTLGTAPQMHVDFVERSSKPMAIPTKPAAERNGKQRQAAAPKPQASDQSTRPADDRLGINAEEPIVIRWNGPMTVSPAPDEALKPESEDDAVIRFAGTEKQPVHLYGNGGEIVARWAAYQTHKEFAWVEGSEGQPVKLTDAKGSILLTPQLRYSQQDGKAILRGPSSALVKTQQDGQDEQLKATWRDIAEASFTTHGSSRSITSLALKGDVSVEHPQLRQFNAGVLRLDFDPTRAGQDASAQLKQITASEQVVAIIADEQQELQSIRAETLAISMAQGESGQNYASRVEASGSVVAGTDLEQIQADSISAELDPPSKAVRQQPVSRGAELAGLQKLIAIGHVKVQSAKGETITADRLQVRQAKDRSSWVLLEGAPATVTQEQTLIAGPFIELDTATERAITTGGGRLVAANAASGALSTKGRPVEVTWSGDGNLDGAKNTASLAGNVLVKYVDSDGSVNEAQSDRVEIELAVKPGAKKETQANDFAFMADRYPRKLTLLPAAGKDVRLQSLLPGPGGTIARQANLLGPRLDLLLDDQGVQRMEVPAQQDRPGRLLYIELPVATRAPVKTGDPLKGGQLAGSTAFAWHEMLSYDKSRSQLTLTGGIMVRHEPQTPGAKKFQVDADKIIADLAEKTGSSSSAGAMDIRKLTLLGGPVHLVREDTDLTAPMIEIDPARNTVLARGTQQSAVDVQKGRMLGTFEWVQINSETSEMKFGRAMASGRQ